MPQLVYYHSTSENKLASLIMITKMNNDLYKLLFAQELHSPDFDKITTTFKIMQKYSNVDFIDMPNGSIIYKNTVEMTIKALNNPPPEKLFKLIKTINL